MTTPPDHIRARLRSGLTAAMKARDKEAVAALRTALAAIDDAEAVPVPAPAAGPAATGEYVAGTGVGLGSTEAARRELTLDDLHAVVRGQIDERVAEAATYDGLGRADAADRLRREAALLETYLPG
ncbi:hypothetical protein [Nakamurella sp.]|uniref:hypothetical protein n=1 Tax=Nakamurella sp. TaxID=1869182 RepID=UPI003B3B5B02